MPTRKTSTPSTASAPGSPTPTTTRRASISKWTESRNRSRANCVSKAARPTASAAATRPCARHPRRHTYAPQHPPHAQVLSPAVNASAIHHPHPEHPARPTRTDWLPAEIRPPRHNDRAADAQSGVPADSTSRPFVLRPTRLRFWLPEAGSDLRGNIVHSGPKLCSAQTRFEASASILRER